MDPDAQDFKPTEVPNGSASPFLIRLADHVVVFQPRKKSIRVESFIGALRAELKTCSAEDWEVRPLRGESSFEDWRKTVDCVTRMRFRAENSSSYGTPRTDLMRLIIDADPELATICFDPRAASTRRADSSARFWVTLQGASGNSRPTGSGRTTRRAYGYGQARSEARAS